MLEVLIAGALAAAMFAALLSTIRDGRTALTTAARSQAAMAVARNHLAVVEPDISHALQHQRGRDGAFDWRVEIARAATAAPPPGVVAAFLHSREAQAVLYAIEVDVSWSSLGRTGHVRLATHRLGFAAPRPEGEE